MKSVLFRFRRPFAWAPIAIVHLFLAASFLNDTTAGTDAARTGFPLDDSWIHMIYGKAVANYGFPYYNDGQLEAGFTSPMWMFCVACAEFASRIFVVSPVALAKALGIAAALGASLLVFELNVAFTGNLWISLVVAVLAAGTPLVAFSQVSGMEANLCSALLLAAILALDRRRFLAAGILCGLAYLTRPESVVLAPLLVLGNLISERRSPWVCGSLQNTLKLALPLLLGAGAWMLYCLSVNGHPLPNTYYAKFAPVNMFGKNMLHIAKEILLEMPVSFAFTGIILYCVGAAGTLRTVRGAGVVVLGLPWAFLVGVAASREMPLGCGTYYYWWRYVLPVLPVLHVPLAMGCSLLWKRGGGSSLLRMPESDGLQRAVVGACLSLAIVGMLSQYPKQLAFRRGQFSWNCQNINEVQVAFGRWVRKRVPLGAAVLVNDAGAIRYFGERRTIDLLGLNSHELLFDKQKLIRLSWDVQSMSRFMSDQGATHLIISPSCFPILLESEKFAYRLQPEAVYRSVNYTVSGGSQETMVAYRLNR